MIFSKISTKLKPGAGDKVTLLTVFMAFSLAYTHQSSIAQNSGDWFYNPFNQQSTHHLPYGSLWAIPPVSKGGPDLDKLGLSEKGMRLAENIRDYGIYVVDGGGAPSVRCDQDFSEELRLELVMETRKFHQYLRMVVNSVPDEGKVVFHVGDAMQNPSGPVKQIIPGEFPAGGGTPLAPNTAVDAVTSAEKYSHTPPK